MVLHDCPVCGKQFTSEGHLSRHVSQKQQCRDGLRSKPITRNAAFSSQSYGKNMYKPPAVNSVHERSNVNVSSILGVSTRSMNQESRAALPRIHPLISTTLETAMVNSDNNTDIHFETDGGSDDIDSGNVSTNSPSHSTGRRRKRNSSDRSLESSDDADVTSSCRIRRRIDVNNFGAVHNSTDAANNILDDSDEFTVYEQFYEPASDNDSTSFPDSLLDVEGDDIADNIVVQNDFLVGDNENTIFKLKRIPQRIKAYDCNEKGYIELLHILDSLQTPPPLETFNKILNWASHVHANGFDFQKKHPLRRTFLSRLQKEFKMETNMPRVVDTEVEGPEVTVPTVVFDCESQIKRLLSDPVLMQPSNLVLNPNNPFAPYTSHGPINEILDGCWYKKVVKRYGINEFCAPIVLYMDKTGGDKKNQRYPVFPVIMTLAIFNRKTRQLADSWKHLGFIADDDSKVSSSQKKGIGLGGSTRNFHKQLDQILQPLYELQKVGMERVLKIGDYYKRVRVFFPICMIMGDGQMGNAICGRYQQGKGRVHRGCDCPLDKADDTEYKCNLLVSETMRRLVNDPNSDQQLKELSQHRCELSFFKADFGECLHGVFDAQPPCLMHVLSEGIVEYVCSLFLGLTTKTQHSEIDKYVYPWLRGNRQSIRNEYPPAHFVRGVTKMSLVTADEKIGILFVLAMVAASDMGSKIVLIRKTGQHRVNIDKDTLYGYLHTFEGLLTLEQTLARQHEFWSLDDMEKGEENLMRSIKMVVDHLNEDCPREEGHSWKLSKVHDLTKFPHYISKVGSPANFNAAIGETLLKPMAKHYLSNVQFRRATFLRDLAQRVLEEDIIHFGMRTMDISLNDTLFGESVNDSIQATVPNNDEEVYAFSDCLKWSTRFTLSLREHVHRNDNPNISYAMHVECHSNSKSEMPHLHSTIVKAVKNHMESNHIQEIHAYSQFRKDDYIIRAHPDFNGEGPWYDWCYVAFYNPRKQREEKVPCKILLFFHNAEEVATVDNLLVLMHCCKYKERKISTLFTHRWLEYSTRDGHVPLYQVIPVSAISHPAYCFEECPGFHHRRPENDKVIVVLERSKWPSEFYNP